jgi:protein-S-isoprenylcysteine O-methyltransferase Ste14
MSILKIILAIAVWGIVHSILASSIAKDTFRAWLGNGFMRPYRLAYNVFSVLSFAPILWLAWTLPNQPLYEVPAPWRYLMLAGQGASALMLLVGVLQTDTLNFIGLGQLFQEKEQPSKLVVGGLYRYMRHPLYTAGLLFLWLTPGMSLNTLTLYIASTLYILVGAYFEERKLLREFGQAYAEYQRQTPMLLPRLFRR